VEALTDVAEVQVRGVLLKPAEEVCRCVKVR